MERNPHRCLSVRDQLGVLVTAVAHAPAPCAIPLAPFVGNLESLDDGVHTGARPARRLPELKILVTSRERLDVRGEQLFIVSPRTVPACDHLQAGADVSKLARNPAVALFLARARAANPDFTLTAANVEAVTTICCRLDGLPLAIELAAARVKLLAPGHWLRRLEHRLAVLTEGARDLPARQQTWRATLDWSYDLLNEAERCLLARLSGFVGGCALEWSFGREAPPADAELGLRLAVALSGFWTRRDYHREGHEWFERALAADDA